MLRPLHYLSWKLQGYFSKGPGCVGLQLQLSFSSSSSQSSFFQSSSVFWTARRSWLFFILHFDVFLRLSTLGNKDWSAMFGTAYYHTCTYLFHAAQSINWHLLGARIKSLQYSHDLWYWSTVIPVKYMHISDATRSDRPSRSLESAYK